MHIRSVYLAAIEEEDWTAIGAPVYVRGFMRTYARFLGLDAEAAVARFTAVVPVAAPVRTGAAPSHEERLHGAVKPGPSIGAIVAIVVAVVLIGFVGFEFYQYRGDQGVPVLVPVAATSGAPDAAAVGATPTSAADGSLAASRPAAVPVARPSAKPQRGLSIHLTQKSWLRVSVDGRVAVEGIFPAGTAKSFTGKSADVRVGNAGGVRIAVNGRNLGSLGADGDVVERQFNLAGE